jgi:hypothetical protein
LDQSEIRQLVLFTASHEVANKKSIKDARMAIYGFTQSMESSNEPGGNSRRAASNAIHQ